MKRFYLTLLLAAATFMVCCKMDTPDMTGVTDTTTGFQPLTKGSTWSYHQTFNSTDHPATNEVISMSGKRSVINGKTYYEATDKADTVISTTYFYQGNGSYSIRSAVLGSGITVEYLYLKDDVAVGQTWTAPISDDGKIQGFPAQIVGRVINRDTSMTISSMTFKHVAHTQLKLQYKITTAFETYQLIDFYIGKGVGIIEIDTDAGQPLNLKSQQSVTSYKIEK
ncbi:hypothetical protein ACFS5N_19410 [Mucilaginibacter ximonensis]|uniref:Lipoprotein n=1 Tax=Mucilaginibacter ximonensis TaxID=538021 RepID=A0ABW5YH75_9SPHI